MKRFLSLALLCSIVWIGGCTIEPAPRPRVVEREVYVEHYSGPVEREVIVEEDPPPPERVEVITVAPYRGAVWERGHWARGPRHRWVWVSGHWR